MIFRQSGRVRAGTCFKYNGEELEIVSKFCYLGLVFTTGGSFSDAQATIAGQALKSTFIMKRYLHKFNDISIGHQLSLYDKLIIPILSYGQEVWGFEFALKVLNSRFCRKK